MAKEGMRPGECSRVEPRKHQLTSPQIGEMNVGKKIGWSAEHRETLERWEGKWGSHILLMSWRVLFVRNHSKRSKERKGDQNRPLKDMNFCRLFLSRCSPLMTHFSHCHTKLSRISEESDLLRTTRGGSHRYALLEKNKIEAKGRRNHLNGPLEYGRASGWTLRSSGRLRCRGFMK